MAKIRGIKPEFWTDEDVVDLSIAARLLFIGMWNFACDNGHLADKPKQIKMRVMPADPVDVDELLGELVDLGRIERAGGTLTIRNFAKHQRPHRRWWSTCDLPLCNVPDDAPPQGRNGGDASSNEPGNGGLTVVQPLRTGGHGGATADGDGEVDGEVDGEGEGKHAPAGAPTRKHRGTRLPDGWLPDDTVRQQMQDRFPGLDFRVEHEKFVDHWAAQPGAKGVKADWNATWRNWIRKSAEYAPKSVTKPDDDGWRDIPAPPPGMFDDFEEGR